MSEYFLKPNSFGVNVKVELDLSNYATKADLENETGVDKPDFAKELNLDNLKSHIDEVDIDKLENVPNNLSNLKTKVDKLDVDKLVIFHVDLSKLSDVVRNDVVQKTEYNELVKKLNNINTTNTSNLVKKLTIAQRLMKLKNTDLDYSNKYITTQEFNKLTSEIFTSRLAQASLANKNYLCNFVKKTDFDDKLKRLSKKILQRKQNIYLLKMNLKHYRHLTQVFLSVNVTLIMMEHNFTLYFNRFIIL